MVSWTKRNAWSVLALVVLLLGVAVMAGLGEGERTRAATDTLAAGSQSARVAELQEQLPAKDTSTAIVLFSSADRMTPAQLATVRERAGRLAGSAQVPLIPSEDGTAAIVPIVLKGTSATVAADEVGALRTAAKADLPSGVSAQVTGPAAVQADLAAVFEGADIRLLASTALVVAVLLVFTYRSPVLWIIPLTVVGVADRLAAVLATHVLAAFDVAWDESTTGILSVLVFGAGTDYALLLIARYRDELRRHPDRHVAMRIAARQTVEPVVASATTVFVGLLTLLLSLFPTTRGLGLACAVGVLVAAFFALVVLPGALVAFGRWIFWPRVPHVGDTSAVDSRSIWRRVGDAVSRRPVAVALVSTILLAAAGLGVLAVKTGLSSSDQFLRKPEAIAAAERLSTSFPAGSAEPMIVMTTPAQAADVTASIKAVQGISSVRPAAKTASLVELQAVSTAQPGTQQSLDTVYDVRGAVAKYPDTAVGGSEAQRLDEGDATSHDRAVIFPLVLGLVFVALILLLRSLVAPVVLVATVLLTYVAALGIAWLVFTQVLGFERLDAGAPLLAFVFLVALGVDYNIFLVTRAKEEAAEHGSRAGMLRSLTATGGVITSAGILLAAVFAVLGVLPLVVLAQLGVIIFIGVLLDTLVVRTVLVPSLALILGDRFWWPRSLYTGAHRA